jgi:hypothetical protein
MYTATSIDGAVSNISGRIREHRRNYDPNQDQLFPGLPVEFDCVIDLGDHGWIATPHYWIEDDTVSMDMTGDDRRPLSELAGLLSDHMASARTQVR